MRRDMSLIMAIWNRAFAVAPKRPTSLARRRLMHAHHGGHRHYGSGDHDDWGGCAPVRSSGASQSIPSLNRATAIPAPTRNICRAILATAERTVPAGATCTGRVACGLAARISFLT